MSAIQADPGAPLGFGIRVSPIPKYSFLPPLNSFILSIILLTSLLFVSPERYIHSIAFFIIGNFIVMPTNTTMIITNKNIAK